MTFFATTYRGVAGTGIKINSSTGDATILRVEDRIVGEGTVVISAIDACTGY